MDGIKQYTSLYSSYFNQKDGTNKEQKFSKKTAKSAPSFNSRQELLAIASAHNQSQVKRVISRLGIKLDQAKKYSDNPNLIRQIKVVMAKGSDKIKNLKIEEKQAKEIALAKEEQKLEKAKHQEESLRLRRTNRKNKELSDVKNADTSGDNAGISSVDMPSLPSVSTTGNIDIVSTPETAPLDTATNDISV